MFEPSQTVFYNNSALIYGDDVSCVPQKLVILDLGSYMSNEYKCSNASLFIDSKGAESSSNRLRQLGQMLNLEVVRYDDINKRFLEE
jgi:hypothetical protein